MAPRHSHGDVSVTGLSNRVSKLETNVEVLGNQMKSLAEDIAISDRKQDNFFDEWRRQKESERVEKEKLIQARQTTPRDMIMMLAACVTMCAALAGFGNYIMQTNIARATEPIISSLNNVPATISAAVTPLTERQNSASQSLLNQRDAIDKMGSTISDMSGKLSELQRVSIDSRGQIRELEDGRLQAIQHRSQIAEQIRGETQMRIDADAALRDELRFFKQRMESQR